MEKETAVGDRMPSIPRSIALVLICLALAAAVIACASDSSGSTTTDLPGTSTTVVPTTNQSVTTTTLSQTMSEYDRELAKTAKVQLNLATYLTDQQAPDNDPRMGIIYGLRARTQGITCRKALSTNELAVADAAMKDIYLTLNLSRTVAAGVTAETLAEAREIVATLGVPSDNPEQAATLLDQFITRLAPLLDEATAITDTTTSS